MSLNNVMAVCLATMLLLTGCTTPGDEPADEEKDDTDLTTAKESEENYEGDDPGECADDADNDRDGLFDCDDSDCQGSKACPEEIAGCTYDIAANYNADASVDDGSCDISSVLIAEYDRGYTNGQNAGYNSGYDDGWMDGYNSGYDGGDAQSTLDTVIARGSLKCGVKDSQYGMGYLEADGIYTGLDIEYCRAIAAAIGLDPGTDIVYVLATASNRFELLYSEEIDVLIRTTTWTTSRDADLNADFAGINFYDGQGMLVNLEAYPGATSALDLDGAKICVGVGTTTEGNIADYFQVNGMSYEAVNVENAEHATEKFVDGDCDVWTGDMSALVAQKWSLEQGDGQDFDMAIMPELLSKEPLAAATRDNDDDWNDVVTWVWYGMLTAEELGIDSSNYGAAAAECDDTGDPYVCRLLTQNLGLGTEANPLSATWMQSVLAAVGNYYEAYDRSFCDGDGPMSNCLMDRAGSANAPWWEGGLQYAPPMR